MLLKLTLLALAGGCGALARHGLSVGVQRIAPEPFPLHTLVVNLLGCFLFGLFFAMAESRSDWPMDLRVIVLTGFMGSFTTFSTYAFETAALMRETQYALALVNFTAHNVAGLGFLVLGLWLGGVVVAPLR